MGAPLPKDTKYQSSDIRRVFGSLRSPQDWVVLPVLDGAMRVTPSPSTSRTAPCTGWMPWASSRMLPATPRAMLLIQP